MRIAVVGAGGVGGLLGGMLARSGADVSVVARGAQLEAIAREGLRVEGPSGGFTARVRACASPSEANDPEAVLVAVKAWQVAEVAETLREVPGFVVPLQNGVEAHDRLAAVLGEERVVGGLCHMLSWIERPGVVRHAAFPPSVTVGEWSGGGSERLERLAAALQRGGIKATVAESVQAEIWEKALFVEAFGAVGAAVGLPVDMWRGVPESRALLIETMNETAAVARALGLDLGTEAVERSLRRIDALPAEGTASMHRDLHAHRHSELDDQTGAIVRIAARHGVPAPAHRFLLACLKPHDRAS